MTCSGRSRSALDELLAPAYGPISTMIGKN